MESKEPPGYLSEALGGLAAMLVALPSAIAFGVIIYAVLGPSYTAQGAMAGLLGAAALGIVAPFFGGAPRLVSAPCAPAAAVLAALAAKLATHEPALGPEKILVMIALMSLLSGGLQLLYGAIGGGRLIKFIPYPVVTGYLSGVAVLIFLGQVPKLLGLAKGIGLWQGVTAPSLWNGPALVVGLVTMAAMLAAPRLTRAVPAPIVGLAAGIAAYFGLALQRPGLLELAGNPLVIGPIAGTGKASLGSLLERWSAAASLRTTDLRLIVVPALTLSVLLSIDTLKTCVAVDALTRSRHDSNRELRGQGLANLLSALIGGMPGAGTMGATLINVTSGGRTQLSGVFAGVFSLLAFLLLGKLVAWVPLASLAGILIVIAWRMFDRKTFRLLRKRSTIFDFAVGMTVIVVAVADDLITAAGVGLAMAILLFIRDLIRGSVIRRKTTGDQVFSKQRRLPAEMETLRRLGGRTVVCELQGSLFFGTTDQLFTELEADLKSREFVILDLRRVQSVDFTAAHMLKQIEDYLHDRQGRLLLSALPQTLPTGQDLQLYFAEVGLVKPRRNVTIFNELDDALAWAEDRILSEQAVERPGEKTLELAEVDLLRDFEPGLVERLRGFIREDTVEAGRAIFRQGDIGDELMLIRSGLVRIALALPGGKTHHLATFGRGDFFGEVAFLDRGARTADATATTPVSLYSLSRARFDEFSRAHPAEGVRVFARLARALGLRLRQADLELAALQES